MSVSDVFLDAEFKCFQNPHLSRCIRLCESTSLHMWVTGDLQEVVWTCKKQTVMCQTRVTYSPLPVAGQSSVCYHLRST